MQELKNKKAAVVVFSGGQDSTTCLFWAVKRYETVIALSFDYHQKHALELPSGMFMKPSPGALGSGLDTGME